MRSNKKPEHLIPQDKYSLVLNVIEKPDVVYKNEKGYFVFVKQIEKSSMKVVFGQEKKQPLELRTISHFDDDAAIRDAENSKGVVYEK